jgi:dihydroorotate dehydrogenase electron transfer subunit
LGISTCCREARVLSVAPHGPHGAEHGCFTLELENPGLVQAAAGQFVMVRPAAFGLDPVWPRPFSICRLSQGVLTLFIQVCGRGTDILARLAPGDTVTLWGPLGQGFAVEPETPTVMLAGGVGLAPFVEYAASHPHPANLSLVFGHRAPLSCYPFESAFRGIASAAFQERTPEDRQTFCALLDERVAALADGLILACGPRPFLLTVARLARKYSARAQVSLENRMACGVGGCLGCVEKDALGQYVQTCTQGPVFWVEELALTEDA